MSPLILIGGICLLFVALGLWSMRLGFRARSLAQASVGWPTVTGKVTACDLSHSVRRDRKTNVMMHRYEPKVCYAYDVGGQMLQSQVIRFGNLETASEKTARGYLERYPLGSDVTVRYNPEDPSVSTLETVSAGTGQIGVGIAIIVIATLVLVGFVLLQTTQPGVP